MLSEQDGRTAEHQQGLNFFEANLKAAWGIKDEVSGKRIDASRQKDGNTKAGRWVRGTINGRAVHA